MKNFKYDQSHKHYCKKGYAYSLSCYDIPPKAWGMCISQTNKLMPIEYCETLANYCMHEPRYPICVYPKRGIKLEKNTKNPIKNEWDACVKVCKQNNQIMSSLNQFDNTGNLKSCSCLVPYPSRPK